MVSGEKFLQVKVFLRLIGLIVCIFSITPAFAQVASKSRQEQAVRESDYTDEQLLDLIAKADANRLTDDQLVQYAVSRGMPASEIQRFQARIKKLRSSKNDNNAVRKSSTLPGDKEVRNTDRTIDGELSVRDTTFAKDTTFQKAGVPARKKIFGVDFFSNAKISFEPNLRVATPPDYQLGPGDEILIDIYGFSVVDFKLTVSPEGTINVPSVGVIQVGGMTMENASARIRSRLEKIYTGLKTGKTAVAISLGNIRTIRVNVIGEVVAPGSFSISSLSTAMNALYTSGGPTANASFRQISVTRGNRKIATLDLYEYLLNGSLKNNVRLQDHDVINVPVYNSRVEIGGEVKRPGIFEMAQGETFSDLLRFSGGFTDSAYRARITVDRNTDTEHKLLNLTPDSFGTYLPAAGDKFTVGQILPRYENRVTIEGAVYRPGDYELTPGMTLRTLIQNAEGLRGDAYRTRVRISRQKDDLQPEMRSVNIGKILSGQDQDVLLKKEDVVTIASVFDLKEEYTVEIAGEVQHPDVFPYSEGMSLEDLILMAGNFKESATPNHIEVSRRVKNSDARSGSATIADVFNEDVNADLSAKSKSFILQPFDIVSVRASSGYAVQRRVRVEGEVVSPGYYTLSKKDQRISDMIAASGNFTAQAYPEGAFLTRVGPKLTGISTSRDSLALSRIRPDSLYSNTVGIDLPKIMRSPGGKQDIFMEDGDILFIPKELQTVKVSGKVLSPRAVIYTRGQGLRTYISSAGGFAQNARKRNTYIQYANGSVKSTRKFFFFTDYPPVKPGAQIIVPSKEDKRPLSLGEIIGVTTGLASLGAIVLGILNLSK